MNLDLTLYLVTEEAVPLERLLTIVEQAIEGGITLVQLREKKSDGAIFYEKAKALKKLLDQYEVPLIINDRIDVALAVKAAGVHVGQSDLSITAVRSIIPKTMIVGVSVSTVEEALAAEKGGADYIGVGAAFPTGTKSDAKVLPVGMLKEITQSVSIQSVAIGGIGLGNIGLLRETGIAGVAVVSVIMEAQNPMLIAKMFCEKWR